MATARCSVRPAAPDDLPALRRLAVTAFDLEPVQRAQLVDLLYERPPDDPTLRIVAEDDSDIVGFAFGARHGRIGHLDAIAVDARHRRRRVASTLLGALEGELRGDVDTMQIGGNTWFYAWPGIDLGYTAAICFAERHGYTGQLQVQNMDVPLAGWIPGAAPRSPTGTDIRRANPADWPALDRFVTAQFTDVWRHEANLAVHREPVTAFVAVHDGDIVGFACHGVYRVDWFGPLAVDESQRGAGTGAALLRACLDDLAGAGIATAQIGWIGPMHFYARTVGAQLGRRFAVLTKPARPAERGRQ